MIATGDAFTLTAAILAVAAVVGFVANRARQPLIVGFIAAWHLNECRCVGDPTRRVRIEGIWRRSLPYGCGAPSRADR